METQTENTSTKPQPTMAQLIGEEPMSVPVLADDTKQAVESSPEVKSTDDRATAAVEQNTQAEPTQTKESTTDESVEKTDTETKAQVEAETTAISSTDDEESKRTAARFAALSRRERKILERENKIKEAENKLLEFDKLKRNAKLDPQAALDALGVTFADIVNFHGSDGKPTADMRIAALERQLKDERETQANKSKPQEPTETQFKQTVAQYSDAIQAAIAANPQKYGRVKQLGFDDPETVVLTAQELIAKGMHPEHVTIEESLDAIAAFVHHLNTEVNSEAQASSAQSQVLETSKVNPDSPSLKGVKNNKTLTNDANRTPGRTLKIDEMSDDDALDFLVRKANIHRG